MSHMMKRDECLQLIRSKLADAGLLLLDTNWRGQREQYRFRCEHGHVSYRNLPFPER